MKRTEVTIDAAGIKKAIAHYLSRQGSLEFDPEGVSLMWNFETGQVTADAISRRSD